LLPTFVPILPGYEPALLLNSADLAVHLAEEGFMGTRFREQNHGEERPGRERRGGLAPGARPAVAPEAGEVVNKACA
jgi:hypothetical protein